ncbi:Spermatogenesis-Associated Protein 31E1 [Manis pentadactyla]|nr:Spermatogenesis-Associated Protein 31E1 [Manis pentadactyla]
MPHRLLVCISCTVSQKGPAHEQADMLTIYMEPFVTRPPSVMRACCAVPKHTPRAWREILHNLEEIQDLLPLLRRIWHSEMAVGDHRASLELSPVAASARSEPSGESGGRAAGDSHRRVTAWEGSTGFRSSSADEDGGSVATEEAYAWKATLESSVPAHSQMTRVDLRSSGTPGTSKIPTLPSVKCVIQDPEEPRLDAQHRDSGLHKKVESGKQPPDSGPRELLQDCDAHALLQHRHSPGFLAADSSASQTSLCGSQSTSSGDMSAVYMSGDVMFSEWASQQSSWGLKGSWRLEEQDKSQSKMFVPTGEEKACRRSDQGQHGKGLAEPRASQDNGMLKNKHKETVKSVRSKSCQLRLKEEQAPPESHFTKERQHFPQGIFSSKVPQQKGRPPSVTAQSQRQHNSRSVPDSRAAGTQGITTAVGQILEERITLQHGHPPSELNWHKGQFQAPAGEHGACFSYHRLLSFEEQGRVTRDKACSLQATLKGHSSPGKSRENRTMTLGKKMT